MRQPRAMISTTYACVSNYNSEDEFIIDCKPRYGGLQSMNLSSDL